MCQHQPYHRTWCVVTAYHHGLLNLPNHTFPQRHRGRCHKEQHPHAQRSAGIYLPQPVSTAIPTCQMGWLTHNMSCSASALHTAQLALCKEQLGLDIMPESLQSLDGNPVQKQNWVDAILTKFRTFKVLLVGRSSVGWRLTHYIARHATKTHSYTYAQLRHLANLIRQAKAYA